MQFSYWEKATWLQNVDHLVVGGGIVGLFSALFLRERYPNQSILVVEKDTWGAGGSTKNAGFACFGSPSEVLDDLNNLGEVETQILIQQRWEGLQLLRSQLGDSNIGYEPCGGIELFRASQNELLRQVRGHLSQINTLVSEVVGQSCYSENNELLQKHGLQGFQTAFINPLEGAIHTGKMYKSLILKCRKASIEILNGFEIQELNEKSDFVEVKVSRGYFNASQVHVCTNGFARLLLPELDVHPARNLVLVTSPIPDLKLHSTFHMERGYFYFRHIEGRVLIGGGRHLDPDKESTTDQEINPLIKDALLSLLREEILPGQTFDIAYEWTGVLGIGERRTAIVQSVSNRINCGVRMGGMGVAIGSLIGRKMAYL